MVVRFLGDGSATNRLHRGHIGDLSCEIERDPAQKLRVGRHTRRHHAVLGHPGHDVGIDEVCRRRWINRTPAGAGCRCRGRSNKLGRQRHLMPPGLLRTWRNRIERSVGAGFFRLRAQQQKGRGCEESKVENTSHARLDGQLVQALTVRKLNRRATERRTARALHLGKETWCCQEPRDWRCRRGQARRTR